MIAFILKNAIAIVGALWLGIVGAAGMYWWDRRPPETPSIHIKVLFGCCTWTAPESLKAQLQDYKDAEAAAKVRAAQIAKAQSVINAAAGAKEDKAQAQIIWRTRTITQEIPGAITHETDVRYALPIGLVRLHDAAALGVDLSAIPHPAGQPDEAPSAVTASAFAGTIVPNYGECRADAERLTALQDWVTAQAAAMNKENHP